MAHQAGFDTVVASLGTALTPGQVALLTRYAKKIALAYDVDPAGQSAGTFGVTELNALISEVQADGGLGLTDVGVVRLPDGKDPDEVIRENPDLWREATRTRRGKVEGRGAGGAGVRRRGRRGEAGAAALAARSHRLPARSGARRGGRGAGQERA